MASAKKIYAVVATMTLLATVGYLVNERSKRNGQKTERSADDGTPEEKALSKFGFNDIFDSKFSYSSISPIWISGTEYIFRDSQGIQQRDVVTDSVTTLMPGDVYTSNGARSYKVSATQEYILLLTNYVKGWRHSYNGTYLVFDVAAQTLRPDITLPDETQYITWAPSGNALAYVQGFNIFYRANPDAADVQVTDTGRANFVYNGIPDWVYEEEMISSNNVMYFSPDGAHLAYAQFNDTVCDHIEFSRFDGQKYPKMVDVSYPKGEFELLNPVFYLRCGTDEERAGTDQPTNKVFIADTVTGTPIEIPAPTELSSSDYLFSRVTWANGTRVMITWCDRLQTRSVMMMCDLDSVGNWACSKAFEHHTPNGWLFQRRPYWIPVFGQTLEEFFMVLPINDWQHLARVDSNNVKTFLTEGEYTVTSYSASYPAIELYDAATDYAYFLSTYAGTEGRQIFRRRGRLGAGQSTTDPPECITCQVQAKYDGRCNYVSPSFSDDGSYLVLGCRGEGPPLYAQYRVDHTATDPNAVLVDEQVLEDNQALVETVNATQMPTKRYGWIDSTATGYRFQYEQWLPPNFDETRKYPMLIDVYAGPGYQNVDAYWTRSWAPVYVPSGLDVVVVRIDGRGSNFHGDLFMHEVYQQLGQKEIDDQIEAARYFGNMPYIDSSRIAIWGWSYGGFATSHALGQGTDILKCGLAVAPLTDWRYYDTIYAERYMGLPKDNKEGYDKANVMNKAANFPQSSYYLIHGMADDNVHFQNAAQLSKALIDNDIDFNNFYYADQDHSINSGPNTSRHVYQVLTRQLCQCFGIPVPDDVWN